MDSREQGHPRGMKPMKQMSGPKLKETPHDRRMKNDKNRLMIAVMALEMHLVMRDGC